MDTKERLKQFLEYLKIGQNAFGEKCGFSGSLINNSKGSIGSEILNKISIVYPELNLVWLITGNGEMKNKSSTYNFSKIYVELSVDEEIKRVLESKLEKRRDEVVVLLEK